jgi:hypothetical protein
MDDMKQYDVRVGEPLSVKLWQAEFERELKRMSDWHLGPIATRAREEMKRQWLAKPWWERASIRASTWAQYRRERLGEFIAGRRFDE